MTNTIFWNVDTQYDFMRDDEEYHGTLAIPGAQDIENNLETLTWLAEERNLKVVNTADWHTMSSREISLTPDFKSTFPPHCLQGTRGAKYMPATNPVRPYVISWTDEISNFVKFGDGIRRSRNIVLYKDEFDVFDPRGGPHTDKVLEIIKPDRAIVYGVATNVCVDYAVMGLRQRGVEVYVPLDAIKELPGLPLPFEKWKEAGVKMIETKNVERYL